MLRTAMQDPHQDLLLSSLRDAEELSISLIQSKSPQSSIEDVFRLELSSKRYSLHTSHQPSAHSLTLEEKGIRDPDSAWPVYRFTVDESQSNFLRKDFLPALAAAAAAASPTYNLRSLSLRGCGRIAGFYDELMEVVGHDAPSLTSLSLHNWTEFISNVCHSHDDSSMTAPVVATPSRTTTTAVQTLFSRLRSFSVDYPMVVMRDAGLLGVHLGSMTQLRTLKISTGENAPPQFWESMVIAMTKLRFLEEVSWTGVLPQQETQSQNSNQVGVMANNTTHHHGSIPSHGLPQQDRQTPIQELFETLGSLERIRKLELSLLRLEPKHLVGLLNNHTQRALTDLSVDHVDMDCAGALASYLQDEHSSTLNTLNIAFSAPSCDSAVTLLEGILRHPCLQNVALHGVLMTNDISRTLQMIFCYNTVLKDLMLTTGSMCNEYLQDLFFGLSTNETLRSVGLQHGITPTIWNATTTTTTTVPTTTPQQDPLLPQFPWSRKLILDNYSALALRDMLVSNKTLERLSLGNITVPSDDELCCATQLICEGVVQNNTLKALLGLYHTEFDSSSSSKDALFMIDAFKHNKVLCEYSTSISSNNNSNNNSSTEICPTRRAMDFFLNLNRLGRQYWLEPNFNATYLLPFVMEKAPTVDELHYILQAWPTTALRSNTL